MTNSIWVNSNYSLLESTIKLDDYAKYCVNSGKKWIALTDINTTKAIFKFCEIADLYNLKPIIGIEFKTHEDHLLLFAKNNAGIRRIFTLISKVNWTKKDRDGLVSFSNFGNMTKNIDLVVFSLSCSLEKSNKSRLKESFKTIFFNEYLPESKKITFKRVNTLHNSIIVDILRATKEGKKDVICYQNYANSDNQQNKNNFFNENFKIQTFIQSISLNIKALLTYKRKLSEDENDITQKKLKSLAKIGLKFRLKNSSSFDSELYEKQLNYELAVINKLGMNQYILVVHDYCKFMMKSESILIGPGRGSAAGSLVCYALHITHIDPLKTGLSFERFLCKSQKRMPDIDIDIQSSKRNKVFDYIFKKYDNFQAAHISTIQRLNSKSALKLITNVIRISLLPKQVNNIIEQLYDPVNIGNYKWSIGQAFCPAIKIINSPLYHKLVNLERPYHKFWMFVREIWQVIEGLAKNESIHPAGLIITPKNNLQKQLGVTETGHNRFVTQFSMDDIAKLGFPKYDLLSLSTLTIVSDCLNIIYKNRQKIIRIYHIVNESKETICRILKSLSTHSTFGVFQLESEKMQKLVHQFKPKTVEELALVISLFRPGVVKIRNKLLLKRRSIRQEINNESFTSDTYGFLIYQEQISKLFMKKLHICAAEAETLRRKLQQANISEEQKEQEFIERVEQKNMCTLKQAKILFKKVQQFGKYAYNKSHATAYATICYWTAFLKYEYPFEYGCALANFFRNDVDKLNKIKIMFKEAGFSVKEPVLFISKTTFIKRGSIIYFPWEEKELSKKTVKILSNLKQPGKLSISAFFRSIWKEIDQKQCKILINIGAIDCFGYSRHALIKNLSDIYLWCQMYRSTNQFPKLD